MEGYNRYPKSKSRKGKFYEKRKFQESIRFKG